MPKTADALQKTLNDLLKQANITDAPESVGTVLKFGDGVAQVAGLDDIQALELVDLGRDDVGIALNLQKDTVGVVALTSTDRNHGVDSLDTSLEWYGD